VGRNFPKLLGAKPGTPDDPDVGLAGWKTAALPTVIVSGDIGVPGKRAQPSKTRAPYVWLIANCQLLFAFLSSRCQILGVFQERIKCESGQWLTGPFLSLFLSSPRQGVQSFVAFPAI
jgi:hypothetical protein